MLKSEQEFRKAASGLNVQERIFADQVAALQRAGLTLSQMDLVLKIAKEDLERRRQELNEFEDVRSGAAFEHFDLRQLGKVLIGARIKSGLTQTDLANALPSSVRNTTVCRDENAEYHNVSLQKALAVLKALDCKITCTLSFPTKDESAIKN